MAGNVFAGPPGHGKTVEAVKLMLKMLNKGINVTANIEGLNEEAIREYCETHNFEVKKPVKVFYKILRILKLSKRQPEKEGTPRELQGKLRVVNKEQLLSEEFYPDPDNPNVPSILQHGEALFIDEVQDILTIKAKLPDRTENWYTKHRHAKDPVTGISSNFVLITQHPDNLNKFVRNLVEMTFWCKQQKEAGLNGLYTVRWWTGCKNFYDGNMVGSSTQFYDKEMFPLYKSYSGDHNETAVEIAIDDRQNIWNSPMTWLFIIGTVSTLIFCGRGLIDYTDNIGGKNNKKTAVKPGGKATAAQGASFDKGGNTATSGAPGERGSLATHGKGDGAANTRLMGYYSVDNRTYTVLQDSNGRISYQSAGAGTYLDGQRSSVQYKGGVATFTGAMPEEKKHGGVK
jgi:zona occludens toxin (predicted ATPase)